eukprot:gene24177-9766_t
MIMEEDLFAAMENKAMEAFLEMTSAPKPGQDIGVPETLPPYIRRIVATYEGGKALIAYITPEFEEIARVSVCPDDLITGYTLFVEDEYKRANAILTRADMESHMVVNVAGRCAERLVVGDELHMTGISAPDHFHANMIAREMVLEFGMGKKTGPVDLMNVRPQKGDSALLQRSTSQPDEDYYYHSTDMSSEQARESMGEIADMLASAEAKAIHGLAINWKAHQSNGVIHFPDPYIEAYGWDEEGSLIYPHRPKKDPSLPASTEDAGPETPPKLTGLKAKTWFAGTEYDAPRDADGNFRSGWHWNMPYAISRDEAKGHHELG